MIMSVYQARKLISDKREVIKVSLDLGITVSEVRRGKKDFIFPDGQKLTSKDIEKIIKKDTSCFLIENNSIIPVHRFSEETNKFYKLFPTNSWPSLEISGIRMHVTKSMTPEEDTKLKISFIKPCTGNILDTCTGLGYTAIMASKTANEVHTCEVDEGVIEMEHLNPYSQQLFTNKNIIRIHGNVFEEIKKLKKNHFNAVIHDPPRQALSPPLYSEEFYKQVHRVLVPGGRFYHYTGDPGSRNRGRDIRAGIIRRLKKIRFKNVERVFKGLVAEK